MTCTSARGVDLALARDAATADAERCPATWGHIVMVGYLPVAIRRARCIRRVGGGRCCDPGEHRWPCDAPSCTGHASPLVGAVARGCAR